MNWYVAGDWGTTRLRLFRIAGGVVADRLEGAGIGALQEPLGSYLQNLLIQWSDHGRPQQVLLCGMAGARNGLREAPYVPCPVALTDWQTATLRFNLHGQPISIAAGIRLGQNDVMRGEETQIFGAMALDPALANGRHVFLLPGTHSKWAWAEDGTITTFRTAFTGELFGLLTDHSTLLRTRAEEGGDEEEQAGWQEGLVRAQQGTGLLGALFESRAAQLLRGENLFWARGFLSGLLIGSEIEEMRRAADLPRRITVIGAPALAGRYGAALAEYDVSARREDGKRCVLAGLELLHDNDR